MLSSVSNVHEMSVTCSCGGTGPGSMLFADVYSLGICVSRLQREHSVLRAEVGEML